MDKILNKNILYFQFYLNTFFQDEAKTLHILILINIKEFYQKNKIYILRNLKF